MFVINTTILKLLRKPVKCFDCWPCLKMVARRTRIIHTRKTTSTVLAEKMKKDVTFNYYQNHDRWITLPYVIDKIVLINSNFQIMYVSLSVKGKFYEIEESNSKIHPHNKKTSRKKELNSDCIYRISNIITDETIFPINLKFISKQNNRMPGSANIPGILC